MDASREALAGRFESLRRTARVREARAALTDLAGRIPRGLRRLLAAGTSEPAASPISRARPLDDAAIEELAESLGRLRTAAEAAPPRPRQSRRRKRAAPKQG